ncbi:MAG: hypothetical protein ACT4O1_00225 [Gemmatimonadota bacterium]
MRSALDRLRERKLAQWALACLAGAWLALQLLDLIGEQFRWSLAVRQSVTIVLANLRPMPVLFAQA